MKKAGKTLLHPRRKSRSNDFFGYSNKLRIYI